jgi:hypothetical protein
VPQAQAAYLLGSVRESRSLFPFAHHVAVPIQLGARMGRIGKSYPRPEVVSGQEPIVKGRVLFLSRDQAIRHYLRRAEPLLWIFLIIGLFGASVAVGL